MDGKKALCRDVNICNLCLVAKNKTHICVIQNCPRCFAPHNILLYPRESEDGLLAAKKDVEGEEETAAAYSSTQLAENLYVFVREGAKESRTLPTREANGDVESGKGITNDDDGYNHPLEKAALRREDAGWMRIP